MEGNMVFDPVKMSWMKAPRISSGDPRSPPVDLDDEEDPFSGIEDLKDPNTPAPGASGPAGSTPNADEGTFVGEEFDLGPSFIRRQREEEAVWANKTKGWVGSIRDNGESINDGWRWQIRTLAVLASQQRL